MNFNPSPAPMRAARSDIGTSRIVEPRWHDAAIVKKPVVIRDDPLPITSARRQIGAATRAAPAPRRVRAEHVTQPGVDQVRDARRHRKLPETALVDARHLI